MRRFYNRLGQERMQAEWLGIEEASQGMKGVKLGLKEARDAVVKLTAKRLIELAAGKPGKVEDLQRLARVILRADRQEIDRKRFGMEEARQDYEMDEKRQEAREREERRKAFAELQRLSASSRGRRLPEGDRTARAQLPEGGSAGAKPDGGA